MVGAQGVDRHQDHRIEAVAVRSGRRSATATPGRQRQRPCSAPSRAKTGASRPGRKPPGGQSGTHPAIVDYFGRRRRSPAATDGESRPARVVSPLSKPSSKIGPTSARSQGGDPRGSAPAGLVVHQPGATKPASGSRSASNEKLYRRCPSRARRSHGRGRFQVDRVRRKPAVICQSLPALSSRIAEADRC